MTLQTRNFTTINEAKELQNSENVETFVEGVLIEKKGNLKKQGLDEGEAAEAAQLFAGIVGGLVKAGMSRQVSKEIAEEKIPS